MRYVLVHSPVLGPTSWAGVAAALTAAGHDAAVPDLRGSVAHGSPSNFVAEAAAAVVGADVVVGHSGASPLLPAIAESSAGAAIVWVDAGLPTATADPFLDRLQTLAVDGLLPPWSEWFGPGVMAALVPDPDVRAAVEAELPRVPLAFFVVGPPAAPLPDRGAYVLLSEAYRSDAEWAAAQGWPVVERESTHLGLVTEPDLVAAAILELVA